MSMTESEAKLFDSLMNHNSPYYGYELCKGEIKTILQGFEELKQYRAIGTIEEFKALKEKSEAKKIKYEEYCGFSDPVCPECKKDIDKSVLIVYNAFVILR